MFPPKSSIRLCRIAGHAPQAGERASHPRHDPARSFGTARTTTALTRSATPIADEEAPVGPGAAELARVELARCTNGSATRKSADLDDRLGHVVDGPGGQRLGRSARPCRCRKRRFMPMRPAELGTVRLMNLIADLQDDAGQKGERRRHRRLVPRCLTR